MRKRISIWLYGGLGTGHFDQGYPMLERLIDGLADTFDIVVYSQASPNPGYHHEKFVIRTPSHRIKNGALRWMIVLGFFCRDHYQKRFHQLFAFWGWPTGVLVVLLGKILRLPTAIYLLGADAAAIPSINYGILYRPIIRRIAMWAYHHSTLLLAISNYQTQQLLRYGLRRSVIVIPWGADPTLYTFSSRVTDGVLQFIHVGHITPVKDQETLIRAFASISRHHHCELRILGVDCMNGALQKLCQELGVQDRVSFLGMVPYTEMPSYYAKAHIMLHTSLSEGQCMAITEAAACGILLAGTRVGLLHDLGDECGVIADFGDHRALAEGILNVLGNPEEKDKKILNARRWSVEHTMQWTINELISKLKNL